MAELAWDQVGDRRYEAGIDRGVLYLPDGRTVAWNGLTGVDDASSRDSESFYLDGVKYLERQIPGDFAATLKAFTYPKELEEIDGTMTFAKGFFLHDQKPKSVSLSYRTRIGTDIDGTDAGYRIHIIYNVFVLPDTKSYATTSDATALSEFSWALSAVPELVVGVKPTAHISFDSTQVHPDLLAALEERLYGSLTSDPDLPSMSDVIDIVTSTALILIIDNGDGTWTATGPDDYITMLDADTFQITNADATFLDADTYEISTTNVS